MCKVLMMTGIKDSELAHKFMQAMAKPLSVGNSHGIGYTASKSDGNIFSERWHNNFMFMNKDITMTEEIMKELEPYKARLPGLSVNYSSYGDINYNDMTTVTMHTRYATCGREFSNTHPFIYNDNSLIHNGVIYNSNLLTNIISTCDSETALHQYLEKLVNSDFNNMQSMIDTLKGYWAFGVLSRNASGTRILDVIKEGAQLYATEAIPDLGYVFCTSQSDLIEGAKTLGITLGFKDIDIVKNQSAFRFNAVTGELLSFSELEESDLNKIKWRSSYQDSQKSHGWQNWKSDFDDEYGNGYSPSQNSSTVAKEESTPSDYDEINKKLNSKTFTFLAKLNIYDRYIGYEGTERYCYMFNKIPNNFSKEVEDEHDLNGFDSAVILLEEIYETWTEDFYKSM